MPSVFEVIAEPNRRAILALLAKAEQSVRQLEVQLRLPQTTVSKHLRILRESGIVEVKTDAQKRLYRLKPDSMKEVEDWLVPFRRLWTDRIHVLEAYLDCVDEKENL